MVVELASKNDEVKRLTKQFQEQLLDKQEIDSKFEEWHNTFQQQIVAKDNFIKKQTAEMKELKKQNLELLESLQDKETQIKTMKLE